MDASPIQPSVDWSVAGTGEAHWQDCLSYMPALPRIDCPVVVVGPHPGDEVLGAGGLMRATLVGGQSVTVISVTHHEGYPNSQDVDRRGELKRALSVLSGTGSITVHHLGLPGGKLQSIESRIADAIRELTPQGGLLVGPFELDGDPDHEAVGRACLAAAAPSKLITLRYPIVASHRCSPILARAPLLLPQVRGVYRVFAMIKGMRRASAARAA